MSQNDDGPKKPKQPSESDTDAILSRRDFLIHSVLAGAGVGAAVTALDATAQDGDPPDNPDPTPKDTPTDDTTKAPGELVTVGIIPNPSEAKITINGEVKGTGPMKVALASGVQHSIRIEAEGYNTKTLTFDPATGDTLAVTLERIADAVPRPCLKVPPPSRPRKCLKMAPRPKKCLKMKPKKRD